MVEFWNDRYSREAYAYGTEPNEFFRKELLKLQPGKILLPAEGEGRNAVFAAKNGWQAEAFDISDAGKAKALQLAAENNVSINYSIGRLEDMDYKNESFDAVALIYAHLPPDARAKNHNKIGDLIKKDGIIIIEGFSKKHVEFQKENPTIGGPGNPDFLYTKDTIAADFPGFEHLVLEEEIIQLNEGTCHVGTGSVIRLVARKK